VVGWCSFAVVVLRRSHYLESDHSNADEYYLEGGHAIANWTSWDGAGTAQASAALDGEQYQAWVDWNDPHDGGVRGVPREEARINRVCCAVR
jgi:hypothetical protein